MPSQAPKPPLSDEVNSANHLYRAAHPNESFSAIEAYNFFSPSHRDTASPYRKAAVRSAATSKLSEQDDFRSDLGSPIKTHYGLNKTKQRVDMLCRSNSGLEDPNETSNITLREQSSVGMSRTSRATFEEEGESLRTAGVNTTFDVGTDRYTFGPVRQRSLRDDTLGPACQRHSTPAIANSWPRPSPTVGSSADFETLSGNLMRTDNGQRMHDLESLQNLASRTLNQTPSTTSTIASNGARQEQRCDSTNLRNCNTSAARSRPNQARPPAKHSPTVRTRDKVNDIPGRLAQEQHCSLKDSEPQIDVVSKPSLCKTPRSTQVSDECQKVKSLLTPAFTRPSPLNRFTSIHDNGIAKSASKSRPLSKISVTEPSPAQKTTTVIRDSPVTISSAFETSDGEDSISTNDELHDRRFTSKAEQQVRCGTSEEENTPPIVVHPVPTVEAGASGYGRLQSGSIRTPQLLSSDRLVDAQRNAPTTSPKLPGRSPSMTSNKEPARSSLRNRLISLDKLPSSDGQYTVFQNFNRAQATKQPALNINISDHFQEGSSNEQCQGDLPRSVSRQNSTQVDGRLRQRRQAGTSPCETMHEYQKTRDTLTFHGDQLELITEQLQRESGKNVEQTLEIGKLQDELRKSQDAVQGEGERRRAMDKRVGDLETLLTEQRSFMQALTTLRRDDQTLQVALKVRNTVQEKVIKDLKDQVEVPRGSCSETSTRVRQMQQTLSDVQDFRKLLEAVVADLRNENRILRQELNQSSDTAADGSGPVTTDQSPQQVSFAAYNGLTQAKKAGEGFTANSSVAPRATFHSPARPLNLGSNATNTVPKQRLVPGQAVEPPAPLFELMSSDLGRHRHQHPAVQDPTVEKYPSLLSHNDRNCLDTLSTGVRPGSFVFTTSKPTSHENSNAGFQRSLLNEHAATSEFQRATGVRGEEEEDTGETESSYHSTRTSLPVTSSVAAETLHDTPVVSRNNKAIPSSTSAFRLQKLRPTVTPNCTKKRPNVTVDVPMPKRRRVEGVDPPQNSYDIPMSEVFADNPLESPGDLLKPLIRSQLSKWSDHHTAPFRDDGKILDNGTCLARKMKKKGTNSTIKDAACRDCEAEQVPCMRIVRSGILSIVRLQDGVRQGEASEIGYWIKLNEGDDTNTGWV